MSQELEIKELNCELTMLLDPSNLRIVLILGTEQNAFKFLKNIRGTHKIFQRSNSAIFWPGRTGLLAYPVSSNIRRFSALQDVHEYLFIYLSY